MNIQRSSKPAGLFIALLLFTLLSSPGYVVRAQITQDTLRAELEPIEVKSPPSVISSNNPSFSLSLLDNSDQAFIEGLKSKLNSGIAVVEVDANINDPAFSGKAIEMMLEMMG